MHVRAPCGLEVVVQPEGVLIPQNLGDGQQCLGVDVFHVVPVVVVVTLLH